MADQTDYTGTIARFVRDLRYDQLPAAAVGKAIDAFVDCSGVMLAGVRDDAGQIAIALARDTGGKPEALVTGTDLRVPSAQAAFVNAILAHALDYDDMHGGAYCHITSILVPVVYALGAPTHIDGKAAIEAYVAGLEVIRHLGGAIGMRGAVPAMHPTPLTGTIGAACSAARLMGLGEQQSRIALALAASSTAGLRSNIGSMTKPFHTGNAARNGVMAAQLAARGFTANPAIFDVALGYLDAFGPEELPADFLKGLGHSFRAHEGLEFKAYPACGRAHAALDALFFLMRAFSIDADDVDHIECICSDNVPASLPHHHARTGAEGKFSMQYSLSVGLLDGAAGVAQYTDSRVLQDDVQAFQHKIRYVHPPELRGWKPGPVQSDETVVLHLKDGRVLSHREQRAAGRMGGDVSRSDLERKFRDCATRSLSLRQVDQALASLLALESLDDISTLEDHLAAAA